QHQRPDDVEPLGREEQRPLVRVEERPRVGPVQRARAPIPSALQDEHRLPRARQLARDRRAARARADDDGGHECAIRCPLGAIGYRLSAIGYLLPATSYQPGVSPSGLATGNWQLATVLPHSQELPPII